MIGAQLFLMVVGGACTVVGAIAFIAGCVAVVLDKWDIRRTKSYDEGYQYGIDNSRTNLAQNAYWFSEDPPTQELIYNLSSRRVDEARGIWRERRKHGFPAQGVVPDGT